MKPTKKKPTKWWGEFREARGYNQWYPPTWSILLKLYIYRFFIDIGYSLALLANKEALDELLYRLKLEKIMGKRSKYFGGHNFEEIGTSSISGAGTVHHSSTSQATGTHFSGNKKHTGHTHKARIPMADVPKERKVVPGNLPKPGNLNRVCSRCKRRRVGDNRFGDCDYCKQNQSVGGQYGMWGDFWGEYAD